MRKQIIQFGAIFLLSMALVGQVANGKEPSSQLVIQSAEADYGSGEIIIKGINFGSTLPAVTLGEETLFVSSATPNEIVAILPPLWESGTYRLTVSAGSATTQYDIFEFTIGAAGLQGPKGDKGDTGATGPEGPHKVRSG